jgi:hypothetical protein
MSDEWKQRISSIHCSATIFILESNEKNNLIQYAPNLLQVEAVDNDTRIHYPVEVDGVSTKPEVTFYPQGSSTPSSTSVASGKLK